MYGALDPDVDSMETNVVIAQCAESVHYKARALLHTAGLVTESRGVGVMTSGSQKTQVPDPLMGYASDSNSGSPETLTARSVALEPVSKHSVLSSRATMTRQTFWAATPPSAL